MSKPIISVANLGKSYLVGHQSGKGESYTALRDVVGRSVKSFGRKAWDMARGRQIIQGDEVEEFWALKDVSFEVNQGEVIGIIGRNGAGKSTLLKVLSRITEPTKGRVTLRGRVASLLEVGTGFHPELTGRENIFLNGAILGMTRAEIKRKFDEIVDFAGVEKFLDTPVKRYSSGMYVRLAFAVAAHLDPEILVVDEVLAVGDAEFQKKCLGKMRDVAAGGRTVLFVSHDLTAIKNLCPSCILLKDGGVSHHGDTVNALRIYAALSGQTRLGSTFETGDGSVQLKLVQSSFENAMLSVRFDVMTKLSLSKLGFAIHIHLSNGTHVVTFPAVVTNAIIEPKIGWNRVEFSLHGLDERLNLGDYAVDLEVTDPGVTRLLLVEAIATFNLQPNLNDSDVQLIAEKHGAANLPFRFESGNNFDQ